ncbi:NADH-cytochrome b5 reductase-like [Bombyx mandarina]|uniref:NADH-cytochrome b5 reductase n=1 Tax=Bombyx mandarina TaxID=7092 RepID=A0A6J2K800_BOMMA|nr:NADH-cytochrome b5 reductase-like [Bombyx mandarina]
MKMDKPVEPNIEDCCGSGCNPCIFDIYKEQLKKYENSLKYGQITNNTLENGISQIKYTNFVVVDNKYMNDTHAIIILKRLVCNDNGMSRLWWNPGDHFLLKYAAENKTCTRAYTPIKLKKNETDLWDFFIVVKKGNIGSVSLYLYNLQKSDITSWRGPYGKYELVPNRFDRIIMIAQGTGLAPFISIIQQILENEDDMTKIILIYCTQKIETIILREELYSYKQYWNFSYKIYLSESSDEFPSKYEEPIICTKFNFNELSHHRPFRISDQYLLCGSVTFMETYGQYLINENVQLANIVKF